MQGKRSISIDPRVSLCLAVTEQRQHSLAGSPAEDAAVCARGTSAHRSGPGTELLVSNVHVGVRMLGSCRSRYNIPLLEQFADAEKVLAVEQQKVQQYISSRHISPVSEPTLNSPSPGNLTSPLEPRCGAKGLSITQTFTFSRSDTPASSGTLFINSAGVMATQAAKAARDQQLKDIVESAATHPPEGGGVITRIDLRDVAVVQSPAAEEGLPGLAEE